MNYENLGRWSAVKIGNFRVKGREFVGVVIDPSRVLDITLAATVFGEENPSEFAILDEIIRNHRLAGVNSLIAQCSDSIKNSSEIRVKPLYFNLEQLEFLPPVLHPGKMLFPAINYPTHGSEQNAELPEKPYFFTKFPECILSHNGNVLAPRNSEQTDYEAELAVIIGKGGKYIPRGEAMNHVFGYTVLNDVSYRDFQLGPLGGRNMTLGMDWVKGKAMDSACPIGPYVVTSDEVPDPYRLKIYMRVNGEQRQSDVTGSMIFKIDEMIEFLSNGLTLNPGDIISTGTPAGVGAFTGNRFLKDGDLMETEVEGIGILRNRVVKEK